MNLKYLFIFYTALLISLNGLLGFKVINDQGKPNLIQFKWNASHDDHPVCSQAYSLDKGKNWKLDSSLPQKTFDVNKMIGVIELRNYKIKQGLRDEFISYFETNFIKSQEDLGGLILGRYRVKDQENNFCWIRGFQSMNTRSVFLPSFYKGAFWKEHRTDANNMLANNDNVYLLRPLTMKGDSLVSSNSISSEILNPQKGVTVIEFYIANSKLEKLKQLFAQHYLHELKINGFHRLSIWTSELQTNDFPQLPVFQDPNLLVVISFFPNEQDYRTAIHKVKTTISDHLKSELDDTITLTNTWILYPTTNSLSH